MPSIVQVNVNLQIAPTPATLQQTGAIISQGGTNGSPWSTPLLQQASDLTSLLTVAKAITSLAYSTGVVTATTTQPHGFTIGDNVPLTVAGAAPGGYNGTYLVTITGASTFTYPVTSDPGSSTAPGTYIPANTANLLAAVTTYFAQGNKRAIYILELGPGDANDGIAALSAYLIANPNSSYVSGASGYFYSYLIPRGWDSNPNFISLMASYEGPTAQTYFFITTTLATYKNYNALQKCAITLIEAPIQNAYAANALTAISFNAAVVTATTTTPHGVTPGSWFTISGCTPSGYNGTFLALPGTGSTTIIYALASNPGAQTILGTLVVSYYASAGVPALEFSMAAPFYVTLGYQPSSTNKVTPSAFSFLQGVTPFPTRGNGALLTTLKQAFVTVVGTGAEGGISVPIWLWGTTMDGNDFTYWYSIDWVQININLRISNAVINGSNNPVNPLYYNQDGINRLQAVAADTMSSGVSFGLVLGSIVQTEMTGDDLDDAFNAGTFNGLTTVNAVPFLPYSEQNPGDYKIGQYSGFAIQYTPARGFIAIIFNVNVSNFVAQ